MSVYVANAYLIVTSQINRAQHGGIRSPSMGRAKFNNTEGEIERNTPSVSDLTLTLTEQTQILILWNTQQLI